MDVIDDMPRCGCGRLAIHKGRCWFRRNRKLRADYHEVKAKLSSQPSPTRRPLRDYSARKQRVDYVKPTASSGAGEPPLKDPPGYWRAEMESARRGLIAAFMNNDIDMYARLNTRIYELLKQQEDYNNGTIT